MWMCRWVQVAFDTEQSNKHGTDHNYADTRKNKNGAIHTGPPAGQSKSSPTKTPPGLSRENAFLISSKVSPVRTGACVRTTSVITSMSVSGRAFEHMYASERVSHSHLPRVTHPGI